jgi:rRNA maturation endonuclease Nob1
MTRILSVMKFRNVLRKVGEAMDREKVIKEYEEFVDKYECFSSSDDYVLEMHKAVLALLKEQEAVKPEMEHSGSGVTWWNVCGNCKTAINPNDKFCHECGRPVLWEGR